VRLSLLLLVPLGLASCGSEPVNESEGVTVDLTAAEPSNGANAFAAAENLVNATVPVAPPVPEEPVEKKKTEPKTEPKASPPKAEEAPAPAPEEPAAPDESVTADSEAAAGPPISNALIARTLRRIGFACGEVASTERVLTDGGSVYRINCTNGQSYRGSTVRGRLRFRRWTGD
jgi:outer membrane biosynthesis protein TonB